MAGRHARPRAPFSSTSNVIHIELKYEKTLNDENGLRITKYIFIYIYI